MRAYYRNDDGTLEITTVRRENDGRYYPMTQENELVPTSTTLNLKGWPDSRVRVHKRRMIDGSLAEEWLIPLDPSAVALGSRKSPKKSASSRENGKKGGRPRTFYGCSVCDHVLKKGEDFCPNHPDADIVGPIRETRKEKS